MDRIEVLINRHSKKSAIPDEHIEKAIHMAIGTRIPNNYAEISKAINAGTPITADRRSEISAAFEHWAGKISGGRRVNASPSAASTNGAWGSLGLDRAVPATGKVK
jgi:septum formation inhibitor-activating ATPase MinD